MKTEFNIKNKLIHLSAVWIFALCFMIHNVSAEDAMGGATVSGGTHASVTIQMPDEGVNSARLYAWAAQDWVFVGSFLMSGNGWHNAVDQGTIKQGKNDAPSGTTLSVATAFPAMMSGSIKYIGTGDTGGGEEVIMEWSVKVDGNSTFKIKPAHAIIALNDTLPFHLDPNGGNVVVNWSFKCSSPAYNHNSGSSPSLPATAPTGQYTVTATDVNDSANRDVAQLEYVGVKQLSAAFGATTIISTTNNPGNNETLYVPKGASSITITATPEPGSVWPTGYPTWKVNGSSSGTPGSATYSLSTATAGEYTVSAACGTCLKTIKIVVVEVASLKGTFGTKSVTSTIDKIANITNQQTMYLYKGQGNIKFQATKNQIGSEWPDGYPKWKDGSAEVGTGETYTFNSPSTTGEHIITAHCGDGYYRAIKVIVFELQATDMAFNYDRTSSSSDGMNLRASYSGAEILAPETTASGGGKKVLYKKDMSVTIKTRFEFTPAGATPSLKVKAVAGGSIEGLGEKSITIRNTGISDGDTIATKAGFVAFNSTKNTADKIKKETYSFQWKLTEINGETLSTPIDLNNISGVTVYTILDTPKSPWAANGNGKTQPWVSALEFATITCSAADKTTQETTLNAITDHLYTIAYQGDSTCRKTSATGYYFCYTTYMGTNRANCLDSAVGLSITAKILGIDLRSRRRTYFFGFNFHCFTVDSGSAYVYDSCSAMSPAIKKMSYSTYISAGNPTSSSAEYAEEYPIR